MSLIMNYDDLTLLKLKSLCKDRGLRVSGVKEEVVIRLMEADEAAQPAPQIRQPTIGFQIPAGYHQVTTQQQKLYVDKDESELANGIGVCIIIYAVFRLFWSLVFSVGGGSAESWLLSPVAFLIGIGYLMGGVITYRGYRNGVYFTLGVLVISGLFSIAFHGAEPNPVSIAWGDEMIMTSIMTSITCMILVALPLLLSTLKEGWPEPIERILNQTSSGDPNPNIKCRSCKAELNVPKEYSGMIECPTCQSQMKV